MMTPWGGEKTTFLRKGSRARCWKLDVLPEVKGSTEEASKAQAPVFNPLSPVLDLRTPFVSKRIPPVNRFSRTRSTISSKSPISKQRAY